jgi:hypothetical protein
MINLSLSEVKIVRIWAERGEESPFSYEIALLNRLKKHFSHTTMKFSNKELKVILHWADIETKGHYGTDRFLLEQELNLIQKIENYLNSQENINFDFE